VRILPVALVFGLAATASVPVSRRLGTKATVASGLALLAVSLATLSTMSDTSGYGLVLATLLVGGVGMGLATTPAMEVTLNALPSGSAGVGSSVNTTAINLGAALGVAIAGSVLSARFAHLLTPSTPRESTIHTSIAAAFQAAAKAHDHMLAAVVRHDFIAASGTAFLACGCVSAAGALLALAFLPRSATPPSPQGSLDESLGTARV
jgi:DHA2 family multidrug resistance protein-like MFS transporter